VGDHQAQTAGKKQALNLEAITCPQIGRASVEANFTGPGGISTIRRKGMGNTAGEIDREGQMLLMGVAELRAARLAPRGAASFRKYYILI